MIITEEKKFLKGNVEGIFICSNDEQLSKTEFPILFKTIKLIHVSKLFHNYQLFENKIMKKFRVNFHHEIIINGFHKINAGY